MKRFELAIGGGGLAAARAIQGRLVEGLSVGRSDETEQCGRS